MHSSARLSPVDFYKPSVIKELCRRYGFFPSKSLGQNFLLSDKSLATMIKAAELTREDTVLEIGPGFGALTLAVAPLVHRLVAFEIEQTLRPYWEERRREYKNIELVWGDALESLRVASSLNRARPDERHVAFFLPKNYKVLANLPYQITSRALRVFLELKPPPERIVVMVQREVADRICARPGEMSLLSVSVQYYGTPRLVASVARGQFWPVPKVESAIVAITNLLARQSEIQQSSVTPGKFFQVVRAGFAHKRKQAWRGIATDCQLDEKRVKLALCEVAGNEKIRAEELSALQWEAVVARLWGD